VGKELKSLCKLCEELVHRPEMFVKDIQII
jgi:hypothetical protein